MEGVTTLRDLFAGLGLGVPFALVIWRLLDWVAESSEPVAACLAAAIALGLMITLVWWLW